MPKVGQVGLEMSTTVVLILILTRGSRLRERSFKGEFVHKSAGVNGRLPPAALASSTGVQDSGVSLTSQVSSSSSSFFSFPSSSSLPPFPSAFVLYPVVLSSCFLFLSASTLCPEPCFFTSHFLPVFSYMTGFFQSPFPEFDSPLHP